MLLRIIKNLHDMGVKQSQKEATPFNGYGLFGKDQCFRACGISEMMPVLEKAGLLMDTASLCLVILTGVVLIASLAAFLGGVIFLILKLFHSRKKNSTNAKEESGKSPIYKNGERPNEAKFIHRKTEIDRFS